MGTFQSIIDFPMFYFDHFSHVKASIFIKKIQPIIKFLKNGPKYYDNSINKQTNPSITKNTNLNVSATLGQI